MGSHLAFLCEDILAAGPAPALGLLTRAEPTTSQPCIYTLGEGWSVASPSLTTRVSGRARLQAAFARPPSLPYSAWHLAVATAPGRV